MSLSTAALLAPALVPSTLLWGELEEYAIQIQQPDLCLAGVRVFFKGRMRVTGHLVRYPEL